MIRNPNNINIGTVIMFYFINAVLNTNDYYI